MAITTNGVGGVGADAVATLSNKTLEAPVINNATFTGAQAGLELKFGNNIVFEGTTADDYETTLTAGDPTADRTVTLPNATTTLVGTDTTDTLSNKTLTAPKFVDLGFIADANGNEMVIFDTVTTAVNEVTIANAATGDGATTGRPTISATGGDSNIALNLVSKGTGTIQANGVPVVTTSGSQTLTNKTLTAPVISSISNTGTITLPTSTDTLVGKATTDVLTNKSLSDSTSYFVDASDNTKRLNIDVTGTTNITGTLTSAFTSAKTITLPDATDTLVGKATTDTLTNKTVTAPLETYYTTGTGFAGYTYYATTNGAIQYITANSTNNGTLNITSTSGQTLNTLMTTGQTISVVLLITNGGTAYYPTAYQVDGGSVTVKWAGGTAPSAGNASAIDAYSFIIIKTGSATFTVLGSQTKFA